MISLIIGGSLIAAGIVCLFVLEIPAYALVPMCIGMAVLLMRKL